MSNLRQRLESFSPKQRALLLRRLQQASAQERRGIVAQGREVNRFPLSFSQQRLWFLDQLEPGNPTYNVPVAVRLRARLDREALARAVNEVVRRHEVLRTTFLVEGDQPVQVIAPEVNIPLEFSDLQGLAEAEARVVALAAEDARRPFSLGDGPLLRLTLLRLGVEEYVLLLAMHHIVSDGWSVGIFIRELVTLYQTFAAGRAPALPPLPIQYADFAVWQRDWLRGEVLQRQLEYWKRQLGDAPAQLKLPTDHERPPVERFRGATHQFSLHAALTQALNDLSRQQDATLFMTLVAAFQTLLYRYTGEQDILTGTPVAGRNRTETEGLIGFFVNTLVLRTGFSGNPTFLELLGRVRKVTLEAYANQEVPFEKLVEALQPERSLSRNPLFQVMFTFLNEPTRRKLNLDGFDWNVLNIDRGMANRDLTLRMEETGGRLVGHLEYNSDLFEGDTVRRMAAHYENLLADIAARPDTRVSTLEMLSPEERRARDAAQQSRKATSHEKFKQFKQARGFSASPQSLVKAGPLADGLGLPLVVEPKLSGCNLAGWARSNREFVGSNLLRHGAILFRNFPVRTAAEFEAFAAAVAEQLTDYEERSTPRTLVEGRVYTSTEYPPDQSIMLHNEVSYSHRWPLKLWFFCAQPPAEGGATPVADSRAVFNLLDPDLREEFMRKRVMYVRNYGDNLDLPWQEVFQPRDRAQVEEYCRHSGIEFSWKENDRLQTRQVRQSVARHPQTGEMVWFNSAHMFHISAHEKSVRDSMLTLFAEDELPRNVYFGDGSEITAGAVDHIRDTYRRASVRFPWQRGDVLMLDNMLAAHGREPFQGQRRILVAMAEPYTLPPSSD